MSDPTLEIFEAMEREATLSHTPAGYEVVLLEDCTGCHIELYPWEVRVLYDWLREHSKELNVEVPKRGLP